MKHGDLEFLDRSGLILDVISSEGLKIARENEWSHLAIEIKAYPGRFPGEPGGLRCSLFNGAVAEPEIDEPSATMIDSARQLQHLFASVGTPLTSVKIEWIDENSDGKKRRQCSYRYD